MKEDSHPILSATQGNNFFFLGGGGGPTRCANGLFSFNLHEKFRFLEQFTLLYKDNSKELMVKYKSFLQSLMIMLSLEDLLKRC